jgi:hypothetical protein
MKNEPTEYKPRPGYESLWAWFGLSYSSWITLPRVLVHEMPDEWQAKMCELMEEWDDAWNFHQLDLPQPYVIGRKERKFCKWPAWLLNYRHPAYEIINKIKAIKNAS